MGGMILKPLTRTTSSKTTSSKTKFAIFVVIQSLRAFRWFMIEEHVLRGLDVHTLAKSSWGCKGEMME